MDATLPLQFDDNPRLEIGATAASLSIIGIGSGESPRIETASPMLDALKPRILVEDGAVRMKLELFSSGPFPFWELGSAQHVTIYVPASVKLKLRNDMGRVRIEKLEGAEVDLATGAGQILLRDVHGQLRVRSGAGKIDGAHLAGAIDFETGAGAIHLQIDRLTTGHHRVESNMGAVRVDLAPGLKVRVDARTSMGSVRNQYPSSPDAEAIIAVMTDLGSVRIREDKPGAADERGREEWHGFDWPRMAQWPAWGQYAKAAKAWWRSPLDEPEGAQSSPRVPDEELRRILSMVQEGKITAAEAEKLIRAIERR